jgi:hypothetical protein
MVVREVAFFGARVLERAGRIVEVWLIGETWLIAVVDDGGLDTPRSYCGVPVRRRLS